MAYLLTVFGWNLNDLWRGSSVELDGKDLYQLKVYSPPPQSDFCSVSCHLTIIWLGSFEDHTFGQLWDCLIYYYYYLVDYCITYFANPKSACDFLLFLHLLDRLLTWTAEFERWLKNQFVQFICGHKFDNMAFYLSHNDNVNNVSSPIIISISAASFEWQKHM